MTDDDTATGECKLCGEEVEAETVGDMLVEMAEHGHDEHEFAYDPKAGRHRWVDRDG